MARQTHTPFDAIGVKSDQYTAGAADITMLAADTDNNEQAAHGGKILVVVHNTDTAAQTVTISSVVDDLGRTGDITTYSLAADDHAAFGPFQVKGWRQSDGNLYFAASDTTVEISIVNLSEH